MVSQKNFSIENQSSRVPWADLLDEDQIQKSHCQEQGPEPEPNKSSRRKD